MKDIINKHLRFIVIMILIVCLYVSSGKFTYEDVYKDVVELFKIVDVKL